MMYYSSKCYKSGVFTRAGKKQQTSPVPQRPQHSYSLV